MFHCIRVSTTLLAISKIFADRIYLNSGYFACRVGKTLTSPMFSSAMREVTRTLNVSDAAKKTTIAIFEDC